MCAWYNELPEHWEEHKISEIFSERREKVSDTDFAPLSVSIGGVVPQIATVAKSDAGDNRKLVIKGDFAINSRSDRRGSSGVSQYDGSVSLINIVLTPRTETNPKYWHYLLKSHNFVEEYYRNGRGIVSDLWTTRYAEMKNIYLPVPPNDEQDQIVRYLDWKVSGINRLVNAKRRQVALLREMKRAVVNEAVTKVGEGWQQLRIKTTAKILRGKFSHRPRNDPALYDGEYPFIQTGDVARTGKYIREYKQTLNEKGYSVSKQFPKGTLTMTIAANIGDVAILDFDACFPDSIIGFIPYNGIDLEYLYYAFYSMKAEFVKEAPINTQGNLNVERVGAMVISIPQEKKQQEIVREVECHTTDIDILISKLNDEIALFAEYRTRLISDVVTGKMDVSSVVVPEYMETECTELDVEESDELRDVESAE